MISEFKNINGLVLRNRDGYLRISNGDLDNPLSLNNESISKALSILKGNSLSKLSFGTPFDRLKSIAFLKDFDFLSGVEIGIEDYAINPLYYCANLEELTISGCFNEAIDFTNFSKLRKVFINWENDGVDSLFNCKQLEELTIVKYSGLSLADFELLPNLKKLVLHEPRIISLDGIGNLKKLESFEISTAKKLQDLGDIENLLNLQKLFIYGAKSIDDFTPIIYLQNLRILNLDNLGNIPTIRFLETLKKLEECYLTESTNILDGDLSVLDKLRKKYKLKKVLFTNRKHYSHSREQLGYQVPASVAAIFKRKK